jgi:hypothetical protein
MSYKFGLDTNTGYIQCITYSTVLISTGTLTIVLYYKLGLLLHSRMYVPTLYLRCTDMNLKRVIRKVCHGCCVKFLKDCAYRALINCCTGI